MENEIIAITRPEQREAMLTAGLSALPFRKEGSEAVQPLATADQQIAHSEGVGQFL